MKKISYKRLSLTFLITLLTTLLPACFQIQPSFDVENAKIMLGFPFQFYMIKYSADAFWFHFSIIGFLANILATYLVLTFFIWIWGKIKGVQK